MLHESDSDRPEVNNTNQNTRDIPPMSWWVFVPQISEDTWWRAWDGLKFWWRNIWILIFVTVESISCSACHWLLTVHWFSRSRPNQIADPGPKSGPARKSESRGPENGVSRWRRPNSDIYSQNHHFGLVYDMIYQFLGMEAKNYKFGIFCQQCHPSVASGDADIRPRNASWIHTCHLFTS